MAIVGTYLVVRCEECGKKYGTSPEKLKKKKVTFPCAECGAQVTAIRPDEVPSGREAEGAPLSMMPDRSETLERPALLSMGLTAKFLLFTILPLVLISVAVIVIADNRMHSLQRQTVDASTKVVRNISENLIAQISETVARQTRQYLFSHPDLRKEGFNTDIHFKKVALQKIGATGSTSLYEIGGESGAWLTWADVDNAMVGRDLKDMTDTLGSHFQQYWQVVTAVRSGGVSKGVYKWPDASGGLRDKFVVATPIEGTPFVLAASIFMDEITAPLKRIESEGYRVAGQIRLTLILILGGGLLLIFAILLLYGRRLTGKIGRLAEWADAISIGQLETRPAGLNSGDEIGELAEAVSRMQESIRLSLERLSKRSK